MMGQNDSGIRVGADRMKGGKRRRLEVAAEQAARRQVEMAKRLLEEGRAVAVNVKALAPDGSYNSPDFVKRGYYFDQPFDCIDCGKPETWTAAQQKWWYEVAKGGVWTTARRCRACRRKERERRIEARRVHLEGIARKP